MPVKKIKTPLSSSNDKEYQTILKSVAMAVAKEKALVAFPTETVYGLGANALDEESVRRIFTKKRRPLSDPVICHVATIEEADRLYSNDSLAVLDVLHCLQSHFWPGPLSLVAKASKLVPSIVTANTGYVAVRCPHNRVALDLIRLAGCPIAAPSCNRFGHISPSMADHVVKEFQSDEDELIVFDGGPCQVGIESTV